MEGWQHYSRDCLGVARGYSRTCHRFARTRVPQTLPRLWRHHQSGAWTLRRRFLHRYQEHYGRDCFLLFYVFCGGQLLMSYLRPFRIDAARAVGRFWRVGEVATVYLAPKVRIILRGDSGFCRQKMLNWCGRHKRVTSGNWQGILVSMVCSSAVPLD